MMHLLLCMCTGHHTLVAGNYCSCKARDCTARAAAQAECTSGPEIAASLTFWMATRSNNTTRPPRSPVAKC